MVEDLLDRGAVDEWREEDAEAKTENRRKAAYKAKLTRSLKKAASVKKPTGNTTDRQSSQLDGWEEFDVDGLLR